MTSLDILNVLCSVGLAAFGIWAIYKIELKALEKGINGKAMALAIGIILAIVLALLGVKIQDVFLSADDIGIRLFTPRG